MGMVIKNLTRPADVPRASKQFDRDNARRYRAVPTDVIIHKSKQVAWIPRTFMLSEMESTEVLLALQSRVEKLEGILRDLGHGIASSAQVLPMRRKASGTEQSAATVVSGNEAEELPMHGPAEQPAPSATAASKPADVVQLPEKAANDDEVEMPPVVEEQTKGASVPSNLSAYTRDVLGWTELEAGVILKTEYDIRDDHCKRKHNGVNYNDLRLLRWYAKDGRDPEGQCKKAELSNFAKFWNKTADIPRVPDGMNVKCLMMRGDNKYAYMRGMAETPKAYRKREQRRRLHLKVAIKERQGSATFQRELRFAEVNALAHEPTPRSDWRSKARAMGMRWGDRWDKVRGWFGQPPRDRKTQSQRELIAECSVDRESTTAELVRRYQRQGISH